MQYHHAAQDGKVSCRSAYPARFEALTVQERLRVLQLIPRESAWDPWQRYACDWHLGVWLGHWDESAAEAAEAAKDALRKGDGIKNVNLLFATLFRQGYGGDYDAKGTVSEILGLEQEDFDEVVKKFVQELGASKWVIETCLSSNHR